MQTNKTRTWIAGTLIACQVALSGCAAAAVALVAGSGAVAGYAVSRDKVELLVERTFAETWDASLDEIRRLGILQETDEKEGEIEATVQGNKVTIQIKKESETTLRLVIRARRGLLPKVQVAQKVATRIAQRLG